MPGATASWHCAVPRHPKGAQGLSFPVGLQETPRAAFPLALSLKVAAELQHREALPVSRVLQTDSSPLVSAPPSSCLCFSGPSAPESCLSCFFILPPALVGLQGSLHPGEAVQGFCSQHWNRLVCRNCHLSSWLVATTMPGQDLSLH